MSTQQLSQLDPKLREVYERVMNTGSPLQNNQAPYGLAGVAQIPQVTAPQNPLQSTAQIPEYAPEMIQKNNILLKTPILIIVALAFFSVYTAFWIRIFDVKLPFPLPF